MHQRPGQGFSRAIRSEHKHSEIVLNGLVILVQGPVQYFDRVLNRK